MTAMYTLKKGGAYDRFIMMMEAFLEENCHVHCLSLTPIRIRHPLYTNHVVSLPFKIKNGFVTKAVVLFLFPFYLLMMGWQHRIDLIIAFGPLYAFLHSLPRWVLRRPMVTFVRAEISPLVSLSRMIEYIGIIASDRVIANNTAVQQEISSALGNRKRNEVKVLFNSIPSISPSPKGRVFQVRERYGIPKDGKLVITAGVLTRQKNFETLLRSFRHTGLHDLYLVIIGDISTKADSRYGNHLRSVVKELALDKKVVFTGWVGKEELWEIYREADLFILPSFTEGMPNVMLEALGVDLPCLGSNIPGIRDILYYEELMFDPYDERAIADKISSCFGDIRSFERVRGLCQERKRVLLFDWKQCVFQTVTEGFIPRP